MNRFLLVVILASISHSLSAQYVYTIKADSVKITNSCDTAELIIENHTQTIPGFLFNKGRGRTEFRRGLIDLTNNVYQIGADTLNFNKIFCKYYKQGGNSFGDTALLGTKDNYPLTFIQNGAEKGRIATGGNWLFNTTQDNGHLAQFNGDVWTSGTIYTDANVNIISVGGQNDDARVNIGRDNNVTGLGAVGIGQNVTSVGGGFNSFAAGRFSSAIGGIAILGSTVEGIALGMNSFAHHSSIAIGFESVTTSENQFVCGGPDHQEIWPPYYNAIYNVYFGSGVQRNSIEGPGLGYTINGSGAFGSNHNGGNIEIAGGKGTGSGTPGSIIFSTAQTTSSGTTLQNLSEKARIDSNGNLGIGIKTPSAMLHVNGTGRFDNTVTTSGHRSAIRNISSDATIGDTDEYVFVDAGGGNVVLTLPSATGRDGQTYTIKRIDANTSYALTITNASSQLIDGQNSYSLDGQWKYITIVANGGAWMIVSKN